MKIKHTSKKTANRPQAKNIGRRGMSQWLLDALFKGKANSKTTLQRGGFNSYPVYSAVGAKLGKQQRTTNK
jgi:hypothetical protein